APDFQLIPIKTRIRDYKSWVGNPSEKLDRNGHETHAVALLLKIAPLADIYIARIVDDSDSLVKVESNVAELTWLQAIKHAALTWQANIITMSFGFSRDVPEIEKVINDVLHERNNKILFFAAALNSGGNARETYPARYPSDISIQPTIFNGGFPEYNPHLDDYDQGICFGTLGENVLSVWLCTKQPPDGQLWQSGASVSTPIATSPATFMLEYVGASSNETTYKKAWEKLQKMEGMIEIFKLMSS
ncbi:peptidase S8/S53 domain-containing protein, partial [Amylocarpus encephaloides]